MTLLRAALLAVLAALAAAAPAPAALLQSDNVTLEGKLPVPAPIGAHFSADGATMFVTGAGGLHTYDVSAPAAPRPLGNLALPHFENEDVDFGTVAGRDIVVITNDPSFNLGAFGALYVVDVTDPAAPALIAAEPTKLPNAAAPLTGPAEDTNGHIANCIRGCDFLYTTGDDPGISIYDLRDPANPAFVKQVTMPIPSDPDDPTPGFTHDVFTDAAGVAWVTGEDGTFGFDVADPVNPQLRYRTDENVTNTDGGGGPGALNPDGDGPLDFLHHNMMRVGTSDVVAITEEDYLRPTCEGSAQGSLQTWQITDQRNSDGSQKLVLLDQFTTEGNELANQQGRDPLTVNCSAHWFDMAGGLLAQGWYDQGVRFLDISAPGDIRQVGYYATTGTFWAAYFAPTDPAREIVYALDTTGSIDVLRIDRGATAARRAPVPARWSEAFTATTPAVQLGRTHDRAEGFGHGHGADLGAVGHGHGG